MDSFEVFAYGIRQSDALVSSHGSVSKETWVILEISRKGRHSAENVKIALNVIYSQVKYNKTLAAYRPAD